MVTASARSPMTVRALVGLAIATMLLRSEQQPGAEAARWATSQGLTHEGRQLLAVLTEAGTQGLDPADYDTERLEKLAHELDAGAADAAEVEHRLDLALALYASDRSIGRVHAAEVAPTWQQEPRDVMGTIDRLVADGRFPEGLAELDPPYAEFRRLRVAYQELVRTPPWPVVPEGATLRPGDTAPVDRLHALAARLGVDDSRGTFAEAAADEGVYGPALVAAVERFQLLHGLDPDGIVGPRTLAALRRSPTELANVVAHALDRWRWMPHDIPSREVRVNVPAYDLGLLVDGAATSHMRVIVGQPDWRTPPFLDVVQGVVLNPDWHVPTSIVVKELAPAIRENPGALSLFEVTVDVDGRTEPVDPELLDWSAVDPSRIGLRQPAGNDNPLGYVKVLLGNDLGVYLHDTSTPGLFSGYERALSHGCVRVEDPIGLAAFVTGWTPDDLSAAIAIGETRTVPVSGPVAVTVAYWTAWVEEDGTLRFVPDVYGYDARMDRATRPRASEARLAGPESR